MILNDPVAVACMILYLMHQKAYTRAVQQAAVLDGEKQFRTWKFTGYRLSDFTLEGCDKLTECSPQIPL